MTDRILAAEPAKPASERTRPAARARYDDGVFLCYLAALASLPFLLSRTPLLAWGINAAVFGTLVVAYEVGVVLQGRAHPVALGRIAGITGLFVLLVGWILAQIAVWTPAQFHHPLWGMAAQALGTEVAGRISLTPDEGLRALVRVLTVACAFWLALQLCRSSTRAQRLLWALVVIGLVYALFGIFQFVVFSKSLLGLQRKLYFDLITATVVDRSAYAAYAGIGLVAALGLTIDSYRWGRARRGTSLRYQAAALLEATVQRGLVQIPMLAVIAGALIAVASTAGMLVALTGCLALVFLIVLVLGRRLTVPGTCLLLVLAAIGGFLVYGAYGVQQAGGGARFAVAERALEAAWDVPWTGFGFGSFAHVFPMYREGGMATGQFWDTANSSAVELVFELGFPGAALLALLAFAVVAQIGHNIVRRSVVPMLSLVALAACVPALVHAVADSTLHAPSVAITYWALLGAGLAQSWSSRIDVAG
ncbi:MAG TPA: O-antigen ligase family protein [Xanthobacteraceae bacterium]|nr:O-antigen ligase family protein [Xanthobacteraceae bacterium]